MPLNSHRRLIKVAEAERRNRYRHEGNPQLTPWLKSWKAGESMGKPPRTIRGRLSPPGPLGLLISLFCALLLLLFLVPPDRITAPVATVISSLVWPFLILAASLLFQRQAAVLLAEVSDRILNGAGFKIANVIEIGARTVEEKAAAIPAPPQGDAVTLANVALLHTSFPPKKPPKFADGRSYLQIEVIVIAPMPVMSRIASVTYRFDQNAYPESSLVYVRTNREERFKVKELANGTSIVRAEVKFIDVEQPLLLNRFIDLRSDGPRI